ncbi:unnamed protein product, partial [Brugia timori]|uniref:Uncharacterized protein n=1 Tax=Brugia timori TaxID=42155 RepID=A0A0R3QDP8_9BILA
MLYLLCRYRLCAHSNYSFLSLFILPLPSLALLFDVSRLFW